MVLEEILCCPKEFKLQKYLNLMSAIVSVKVEEG